MRAAAHHCVAALSVGPSLQILKSCLPLQRQNYECKACQGLPQGLQPKGDTLQAKSHLALGRVRLRIPQASDGAIAMWMWWRTKPEASGPLLTGYYCCSPG